MDVKECYRILELEVDAPRDAVQAAYRRLIERWHPDGVAAAGGPEAVAKAKLMIQAINTAYQTLDKLAAAPGAVPPPPNPPPPASASGAAGARSKTPAASPGAPGSPATGKEPQAPPPTPLRRYAPILGVAGLLVLVLIVGKCTAKSPEEEKAEKAAIIAQTTGRLIVKANRANTTVEATRIAAAGEAEAVAVKGIDGGAAEHALAALPPGKYAVIARSAGWPDSREEAEVDAGRTTELAIAFKSGSLRLDSIPTGAVVKQGNAMLGKTPVVIPQLPPGDCQLTLEYPLWPVATLRTSITENVEAAETVRLPHGKLTLESSPPGATVLLGKRPIGRTPVTFERYQAGTTKLTLQAKDFPPVEVTVTMEDNGELKLSPVLAMGFPELVPESLLRAVWVDTPPPDKDRLSPAFKTPISYRSRNGIVKNLDRKKLQEIWLGKQYRVSGTVKAYNKDDGQIELAEEKTALSRLRVLVQLSAAARGDPELLARLAKGATVDIYGRLTAMEEPEWPARVITIEFMGAELMPASPPAGP